MAATIHDADWERMRDALESEADEPAVAGTPKVTKLSELAAHWQRRVGGHVSIHADPAIDLTQARADGISEWQVREPASYVKLCDAIALKGRRVVGVERLLAYGAEWPDVQLRQTLAGVCKAEDGALCIGFLDCSLGVPTFCFQTMPSRFIFVEGTSLLVEEVPRRAAR